MKPGDRSLVIRCVAGEEHAWRELHRHYFPAAVAFLRGMGVSDAEADDLGQEVFLQIYRHLGHFEERSSFRTWLYKICLRRAGRWRRRERTRRLFRMLLLRERHAALEEAPRGWSDADARRQVLALLSRLKDQHRTVFVLYELEGLSGDEIASITGTPVATVRTRLHYARQQLARLTERAEGPERKA